MHKHVCKCACKHIRVRVLAHKHLPQPETKNPSPHVQTQMAEPVRSYRQPHFQEHRCPHSYTHRALPQAPHAGGCAGRVDGLCHTQLSAALLLVYRLGSRLHGLIQP